MTMTTAVTREEVIATLQSNLAFVVDQYDHAAFDPSRSMMDLCDNSLEAVEVVSRMMRELGVKVPRNRLGKLKNIEELIDAFVYWSAHEAGTQAPSAPETQTFS